MRVLSSPQSAGVASWHGVARWLEYSQIHIAILAIVLIACSGKLAGVHVGTSVMVVGALGAWAVYLVDRLGDSVQDSVNQPDRTRWFRENRGLLLGALLIAVLVSLPLFVGLSGAGRLAGAALIVMGCLYVIPPRPLRKLALLKPAIIAAVWSCGVVLFPLIQSGADVTLLILFAVYRFAYLVPNCLLSDYNDVEGDRAAFYGTVAATGGSKDVVVGTMLSMLIAAVAGGAMVLNGIEAWLLVLDFAGMLIFVKFASGLRSGVRRPTLILDLVLLWPLSVLVIG